MHRHLEYSSLSRPGQRNSQKIEANATLSHRSLPQNDGVGAEGNKISYLLLADDIGLDLPPLVLS